MEFAQIFQALASLIFVLGLLLLTLWGIKFCQQKGGALKQKYGLKKNDKIKILEQKRLDVKNNLVLIEYQDEEILLLLGNSNTVISRNKTPATKDQPNA